MRSYAYYSDREIEVLKKYYATMGPDIPEISEKHSIESIRVKAASLGLTTTVMRRHPGSRWTNKELKLLRDKYPIYGAHIPELLRNRTVSAIYNRAHILGLKHEVWSEEEKGILSEKYGTYGLACSNLLSRHSKLGIRFKAHSMGLKRKKRNLQKHTKKGMTWNRWTPEELSTLVKEYPVCGTNIPALLKTHTQAAISTRAVTLNLTCGYMPPSSKRQRWNSTDIAVLKQKYPAQGVRIPELTCKYTESAIRTKACRLKICSEIFWTDEQVDLLKEKYPTQGSNIPELLEYHSQVSIISKAFGLELHRENFK